MYSRASSKKHGAKLSCDILQMRSANGGNVIAQGNALGLDPSMLEALKARNGNEIVTLDATNIISRLQR